MPMQYAAIFKGCKNDNFQPIFLQSKKEEDIFIIFAQNIDCGCSLEPPQSPHSGGSNEYMQSMF